MIGRPLLRSIVLVIGVVGCYPQFAGLPTRQASPELPQNDQADLDNRLTNCHANYSTNAFNAYSGRRQKYYFTKILEGVTVVGSGISAVTNDKTSKKVGAYVSLGSGLLRLGIPGAETDLEGANSAAKLYDSAWAGARASLDELEAANRARAQHNALKPPDSATQAEKDQWTKEDAGFAKRYNDAMEKVHTALSKCNARF